MRGSVAKRLRKMARLTVGLAAIEQEKATGTRPKIVRRRLLQVWFKAPLTLFGYDQREEFTPPSTDGRTALQKTIDFLARIAPEGWPDPKEFRVWMILREMPGTLRSHYKLVKRRFLTQRRAV